MKNIKCTKYFKYEVDESFLNYSGKFVGGTIPKGIEHLEYECLNLSFDWMVSVIELNC